MADLVRLAYYPFLPEVRDAVRELGPDVPTLLGSRLYAGPRRRGLHRVEGALADGFAPAAVTDERSALLELLSVPVARMLAVLSGDKWLIRRYAHAEAVRLEDTLGRDEENGALPRAAEALGVAVRRDGAGWQIHFSDYLGVAPAREPAWKLVVQPLDRGWVALDDAQVARLCREALGRRIEAELVAEAARPQPPMVREALAPLLESLGPKIAEAREKFDDGDFGPVRRELFPPCILDLFQQMIDGKMVPHHGRFAMASFLATIGMDAQAILEFFREIPNFDPEKSRYQIEHIAGERSVESYTPPGCAWMQTNGVCPLEKRDALCFKIKHPLSYYRARIRFDKEAEARGKAMLEQARQAQQTQEARPGASGAS